MSQNLPEFRKCGSTEELDFFISDEGTCTENVLKTHNAVYRKPCYSKYNDAHLKNRKDAHRK